MCLQGVWLHFVVIFNKGVGWSEEAEDMVSLLLKN